MSLAQPLEIPATAEWLATSGRDLSFQLRCDIASDTLHHAQVERRAVLFDGVLYNRAELERELNVSSRTGNDAHLLLHAYLRWGIDFLDRIKGVFALIVSDGAEGRLVAARDPLGIQPLFYAELGQGGLLLSTSINALLAHPKVSRALNRPALADHLCQRWPDSSETFFSSVLRVPPGHRLVSDRFRTEIVRYWDPLPPGKAVDWVSDEELEEFDTWLETAVERVLCQGPSAVFLSGGLDSTSVACAAADVARRTGRPGPIALSIGFPDPCDEGPIQRGVASSLGMAQEFVPFWSAVPKGSLLTRALSLTRTLSAPLRSSWTPVYHDMVERGRRRGAQVILTGLGGDELLGANALYSADLLRKGRVFEFARHIATWQRSYPLPTSELLRTALWTYGARPLAISMLERVVPSALNARRVRRSMQFAPDFVAPDPGLRAKLEQRIETSVAAESARSSYGGDLHIREVRKQLDRPTLGWHMEESFERGRQLGVKFLHPLWDADLADKLLRTPQPLLYGDGRAKYLVRKRLAQRFPHLGLDRQKKLAATPFFRSTLAAELPDIYRSVGGLRTLSALGVVNGKEARETVELALQSADRRSLGRVWELLNLEAWAESRI